MTRKSDSRSENECRPCAIKDCEWASQPTINWAMVITRLTTTLTQVAFCASAARSADDVAVWRSSWPMDSALYCEPVILAVGNYGKVNRHTEPCPCPERSQWPPIQGRTDTAGSRRAAAAGARRQDRRCPDPRRMGLGRPGSQRG